jgi:methylenetetrahydrofolate reductase (NADPH)
MKTLLRISVKIGVRDAARFMGKHSHQVSKLLHQYRPDTLLEAVEPHLACEECQIAGFHIYSFNQVDKAESWRRELLGTTGEAPKVNGAAPTSASET